MEASGRMEASDWYRKDKLLLLDLGHCCHLLQFLQVLGPSDSTLKSVPLFLLRPGAETLPPASQFVCMHRLRGFLACRFARADPLGLVWMGVLVSLSWGSVCEIRSSLLHPPGF